MAAPLYKRLPAQVIGSSLEGLLGGLGSATEGILGLANTGINALRPDDAKGNILPSRLPLLNLQEARNVTEGIFGKENLQPGSYPEKVLQNFARGIVPTLATAGQNLPIALASSAAGSAAQVGAEELGLPAALQVLAGIGGEKGFSKALQKAGKLKAPQYLAEMSSQAKNKFYDNAKEAGDKFKAKLPKFESGLKRLGADILDDTRLSDIDKKKLIRDINSYQRDFNKGGITGRDFIKRRAELNENIANSQGKTKNYYQAIRQPLIEEGEKLKSQHSVFGKNLNDADALHDAENYGDIFKDILNEYPKLKKQLSNPLAYGLATVGPKLFFSGDPLSTLGLGIGTAITAKGSQKGSQFLGFLRKETPRKLLIEASENVIKRNIPAAMRSFGKLNKLANKYDKDSSNLDKKEQEQSDDTRKNWVKVGNINQ